MTHRVKERYPNLDGTALLVVLQHDCIGSAPPNGEKSPNRNMANYLEVCRASCYMFVVTLLHTLRNPGTWTKGAREELSFPVRKLLCCKRCVSTSNGIGGTEYLREEVFRAFT